MCNLSQGILNEGRIKGRAEGLVEGQVEMASNIVIKVMKEANKSMNEVMDMLGIDEMLRPEIKKAIQAKDQAI